MITVLRMEGFGICSILETLTKHSKQGLMMIGRVTCPEYGAKAIDPCQIETEPQNEFTSGLFVEACEAI